MKITTEYQGNMRFASGGVELPVVMDANKVVGGLGEAPSPKKMVLHGLAGCTGMDVVALLKKKNVEYDAFSIEVESDQTDTHPKVFQNIKITYRFVGTDLPRDQIELVVNMSRHQFCGVSSMLSKAAQITHEIVIEEPKSAV